MDRTGYRPPYMYEPHHTPNYRPPVPRSEGEAPYPWPMRFCAPPPGGPPPQYGPPGRQPLHYNGINHSIANNEESWLQEAGTRRHERPGGVEPGWHGHTHRHECNGNNANEHGHARLPYTEVNRSIDRKPASGMELDNRNTWQHQNNCQSSNNSNNATVMFPTGVHSMPNMAMGPPPPSPNMVLPPPSPNMAVPPPSPNMATVPPHLPCGYPCPPQTTGVTQSTQSAFLQQPPPDCLNVAPPDVHIPQPPMTQYSFPSVHQRETTPLLNTTIGSSHPAVPGVYTDSRDPNNVPDLGPQGCGKDQHSEDQVWVTHWLKQHQHFRRRKTKSQRQITIPETRLKLRAAVLLSDKLKHCCNELERKTLPTEKEREDLCREVEQIKEELSRLKTVFEDGQMVAELQRKLKRRAQKRERLRRQCRERYQEKLEAEEQRRKAQERLDQWQQSIVEKALRLKRDKELKAAADDTLLEVRSKLTDTKKSLQLMTDLQKLRQVRKEMAEKKGLYVRHDVDKNFETRMASMVDMLTRQNETYETEKGLLEVMLETEQQETEERQKEEKQRRLAAREKRIERRIRRVLFGHDESALPSHPLFPYRQYYAAGEHTADAFLQIRQEWDMFLVPSGTEGGSRIPHHWVVPTEPSSDIWASASVK